MPNKTSPKLSPVPADAKKAPKAQTRNGLKVVLPSGRPSLAGPQAELDALKKCLLDAFMDEMVLVNEAEETIKAFKDWRSARAKKELPHLVVVNGGILSSRIDEAIEKCAEYENPTVIVCAWSHLDTLSHCLKMLEENRGDTTPAENFIENLLMEAKARPLTPESVEKELTQFREDFADAVEISQKIRREYPKLVETK